MRNENEMILTKADIQALIAWYQAFRQAAAKEHTDVAAAVTALEMDQTAVPVIIPLRPSLPELPAPEGTNADCFALFQELVLHEFTRLTAADPENPTTGEIATAQIQLAMQYFAVQSFADVTGAPEAER